MISLNDYLYMTKKYPFLAFTFKGRIKSLIRAEENQEEQEIKYLYEIANALPGFLEERGFTPELSDYTNVVVPEELEDNNRSYYRDYIKNPRPSGYQSLHITFYDNLTRCFTELQLRTKDMDDFAEIGDANHFGYEKIQEENRSKLPFEHLSRFQYDPAG